MTTATPSRNDQGGTPIGSVLEVLQVFTRLGLTSFGGPIAHIGYFHDEFVVRRKWLHEKTYADLVALSQFLPGPASSKVGIAIGLSRAGYPGAVAAWAGFTLPSAIALVLFGFGATVIGDALGSGWLHGLKIAAVAVVAQAVLRMMRSFTPDRERASMARFLPRSWVSTNSSTWGAAPPMWWAIPLLPPWSPNGKATCVRSSPASTKARRLSIRSQPRRPLNRVVSHDPPRSACNESYRFHPSAWS
jgi:chromate transport protein ChrA